MLWLCVGMAMELQINRVYDNVSYYNKKMKELWIEDFKYLL